MSASRVSTQAPTLGLFDPVENDAPPPVEGTRRLRTRRRSIQERFADFDARNPHVYAKLREFALQMKRSGKRGQYSMKALWERLRWHVLFETQSSDEWKLNNDFTALYARKLMSDEPELAGFFETRQRQSA